MPYLNCPRCGLSVRMRGDGSTRWEHCPRCLGRAGVTIPVHVSERPTLVEIPQPDERPVPDGSLGLLGVHCRDDGGQRWIELTGELDVATVALRAPPPAHARAAGLRDVVLDISGLDFIDSAGIHALLRAQRGAAAADRRLLLTRPPGQIERVFELTGAGAVLGFER
jgi:anti-anti-sigma factor